MTSVGPKLGLMREGTLRSFNPVTGKVRVALNLAKTPNGPPVEFEVPLPNAWAGPNGEFAGGYPLIGSTVWVAQGEGGRWTYIGYAAPDGLFNNRNVSTQSGFDKNPLSAFREGRWLCQVQNNIRLIVDPSTGLQLGNPNQNINIDPNKSIFSSTFKQNYNFSNASRKIEGTVKRDLSSNSNRNISGSALSSHIYETGLTEIGLDPLTKTGHAFHRNPPFVESREIIYEFANDFGFTNYDRESTIYDTEEIPGPTTSFNRRDSRADVLSLNLIAPNHLIESVKGTVIDVYGNILDINRSVLLNGQIDNLSFRTNEINKSDTFNALINETRKSLAFHWEINSRKQLPVQDLTDSSNYARDRSKFSLDIDKEGQFKINIPMSSETGNIPLLTRYENYSTLKAKENDTDPNAFMRNVENKDILSEAFGVGVVELTSEDTNLAAFSIPIDRITGNPIKLGTAYHDISQTVLLHQRTNPLFFYPDSLLNDSVATPPVTNIVSQNLILSGENANAGGRSGTINLDGFISVNIGANTVDRQSAWFDFAGGVISNIGRDKNGVSYACTMDGDLLIQVGSNTVSNDDRFSSLNNAYRDGKLDIRVLCNAQMHVIRIDNRGVQIISAGRVDIVAEQNMRFKSVRGDIIFDAESIYMYGDDEGRGRLVLRNAGMTI